MHLAERHVIVTGAAGGIGSALARRFHADGARVTLADRDAPRSLAEELGQRTLAVAADVSSEAGNAALIAAAASAALRMAPSI